MNYRSERNVSFLVNLFRLSASFAIFLLIISVLKIIDWKFLVTFSYIPSIQDIIHECVSVFSDLEIYGNILITLGRVYSGFICAVILAIPFAILITENRLVRHYIYPVFEFIRPIPNVAWVPISIVLFQSINSSMLFITFIGAFFPILINSVEGLGNINENYIKIAKSFHVTRWVYITEVMLPATFPNIFTGLLLGMSGSWLGVVVAEMISGQSGIGYLTWVNYTLVNMSGVVMCMFIIGGLGAFSTWLLRKVNYFSIRM
ncbi:ABC transporter permease [Paenibacillus sp. FSL H7-0714]|uniref:ABC transporter permease n=1 Tax=Paenibacillus sp. FSL H7-0714 TaxID=2954735 RepID=UPI0030F7C64B